MIPPQARQAAITLAAVLLAAPALEASAAWLLPWWAAIPATALAALAITSAGMFCVWSGIPGSRITDPRVHTWFNAAMIVSLLWPGLFGVAALLLRPWLAR